MKVSADSFQTKEIFQVSDLVSYRSSRPEVFWKKGVLKNLTKFQTLLKKRLWHRCFPVSFVKFLWTRFTQNTSGGCFCSYVHSLFLYIAFVDLTSLHQLHRAGRKHNLICWSIKILLHREMDLGHCHPSFRRSQWRCSIKSVHKTLAKYTGKHLCRVGASSLIKWPTEKTPAQELIC